MTSRSAATSSPAVSSSPLLTLETVCNTLKLPSTDVIHAFLLGSRLWGTSNSQSDYDAYIVLKDKSAVASRLLAKKGFVSIHANNIDAIVMQESLYLGT